MSPEIEAVPMTPDSPHIVSPMTPVNSPMRKRDSLGKLRDDSGSVKYPPNYSEVWTEDHGKEVVPVAEGKQVTPHDGIEHEPPADDKHIALPHDEKETFLSARGGGGEDEEMKRKRRCCGLALKWVIILVVVIILLAVGLGVGLAFGLQKKSPSKTIPAYTGNATIDQPFLTGIDYDDPFDNEGSVGTEPLTDLFYQRKDGLIRQATMLANGTWLGAGEDDFVATDAKVGTPIAVTSFTVRKNQTTAQSRHLFYIDAGGTLRERLYDNITRKWTSGTLDQLNAKPVSNSGLQVCNGNDYVGDRNGSSYRDGISLFYGYTEDSIQQLGWNMEDKFWVKESTFVDVNGRGGVACHIRPEISTVVAQNKTDVVFYWKDSNSTRRGSATHPINTWQKAPLSIPGIHENAAINMRAYGFGNRNRGSNNNNSDPNSNSTGGDRSWRSGRTGNWTPNRYILTQLSDLTIRAYNITGSAENMALAPISYRNTQVPSVPMGSPPAKGLPGTRLAFTMDRNAVELGSGGRNSTRRTWITWFQTDRGSIGQYMAGSEDLDRWGVSSVDIGD